MSLDPNADWPSTNERGYTIPDDVYGSLRPIKVIAIGAGISGINLAHEVDTKGQLIDLVVYEMGSDFGVYVDLFAVIKRMFYGQRLIYAPQIRCDIPAVNYQMSWAPNPDWSEFYASGSEIHQYYRALVERFKLEKYFRLSHEVVRAEWLGDQQWKIRVRAPNGVEFDDFCNVFINGGGVLNAWKWPDIKGLHDFKGTLCHTARWPKDLDLTGKRVAIIGSGSSGIQVLSTVQPITEKIYHWIRSPTWITSAFAQQYAGPNGSNFAYTEEQKKLFAEDPKHSLKYRKMMESELNKRFRFIVKGTSEQKAALEYAENLMRTKLQGNQRLMDAIIPKNFFVGCRRPTPGNGYLEALLQPNVEVFTEMFQRVTEKGFIDAEGVEHEVDVLVTATGFDTSFRPRFPVIAHGANLQDLWAKYPADAYISICVKNTPNYLMYYGPHGPSGHGSGAPMIEVMTRSFMQFLKKMQMENITSFTVKDKAVDDFTEHRELYLKRTAWSGPCHSWFKPSADDPPIMFPGNRVLFIELLTHPRWEDFDYTYGYAGNRFGYLGSGFTMREQDGRDDTFYYGFMEEGQDVQPNYDDIRPLYTDLGR